MKIKNLAEKASLGLVTAAVAVTVLGACSSPDHSSSSNGPAAPSSKGVVSNGASHSNANTSTVRTTTGGTTTRGGTTGGTTTGGTTTGGGTTGGATTTGGSMTLPTGPHRLNLPPSISPAGITLPGGSDGTTPTMDAPTKTVFAVKNVFPANGQGDEEICRVELVKLQSLDQQWNSLQGGDVDGHANIAAQQNTAVSDAEGSGCVVQYSD